MTIQPVQVKQKITTCLWFDKQAEEAANFYVSIFKDSKMGMITRYDAASAQASGMPEGTVLTVGFELFGQEFVAMNGGPMFQFSGAISFIVNCETQEEVDYYWEKLSEGGEAGICGWINHDRFGVTWQVVPVILTEMLMDKDPAKARRVMQAMLKMKKIDIAGLQKAYDQRD